MFVHKGSVYRQALTPDQKKLKKKYVLQQQMQEDKIPTFEEVWEYQQSFGDLESIVEDYAYDYTKVEADEGDVLEWLREQGIEVPEEPDYGSDEWEEWSRVMSTLVTEHEDTVSEALSEAKALEYIKNEIENLYEDAIYRVENELDNGECWRTVNLPVGVDPTQHDGLGIYWAYKESAAEAHWGGSTKEGKTKQVTYHAKIDAKYIDKEGTIYANTDKGIGEEEREVRFYSGAPIYVYDVTVHTSGWKFRGRSEEETLEVDDWRTT